MILHACQNSQLALHADASGVGVFYHLAGQLHVLVKFQGRSVDHDGSVSAVDGRLAGVEITAVVQVEHHRDGGVLPVLSHRVGDELRPPLLVLQGGVFKVHAAAHEAVGQIGPLQHSRGAEHLVNLDHRLGLGHRVYVEGALAVTVVQRRVNNRFQ